LFKNFSISFFSLDRDIPIHQWVWLAYLRAALIPLLFVELALLGVYMFSHNWSKSENIEAVQALAEHELLRLVNSHSDAIEQQLAAVSQLTELLRLDTQDALNRPVDKKLEDPDRYAITKDGVLYSKANDGGAAVFFSGFMPVTDAVKLKVSKLARFDVTLKRIVDINPLVVQAYFNSHDSLNRIWPYFDVLSQYQTHMEIPAFNFYYEADAVHNPERKVRWIDAYLDPAGQGWMVSSIAPVYTGDFLEGVVGLDITLDAIIKQVLTLPIPWKGFALLINKDGMILALPENGEKLFKLSELTSHHYEQAIRQETFKPDQFNIFKRADLGELKNTLTNPDSKVSHISFDSDYLVANKTLLSTGWRLVIFAPKNEIFKTAINLADKLTKLGWFLLFALVIFYILFFLFLFKCAIQLSKTISDPLCGIRKMAVQIGDGNFKPDTPIFNVNEFKSTVESMLMMANKLQIAEANILDAKSHAEQASYAKGAFLANMSHEIRTPLNAITGLAELAQDGVVDEKSKYYLNQILMASNALLVIVNDILDFSKIEAGKIELEIGDFEIDKLLGDVSDLFIRTAEEKSIDLFIKVDHDVPSILMGDVQRIRQVMTNLVGNAIKFTKQGEIVIAIELVTSQQGHKLISFSVTDTGIGISVETQSNLFKAFSQADISISRRFGGTGLGLVISQQLIELMGGEIKVTSQLGQGSRFEFKIPLDSASITNENTIKFSDKKILVIDESETSCQIFTHYLKAFDCQILTTRSFSLGVKEMMRAYSENYTFDFIFLDWKQLKQGVINQTSLVDDLKPYLFNKVIIITDSIYQERKHELVQNLPFNIFSTLSKPVLRSSLLTILEQSLNAVDFANKPPVPKFNFEKVAEQIAGSKILLVEDVHLNQQIAKAFLRKAGLQVVVANNGKEAVDLVKKMTFDAVLMDLQMPIMDGYEATQQIRNLTNGIDLPIIAMTAAAMQHDRDACIKAGMNDHLSKPLNSHRMIEVLIQWIQPINHNKSSSYPMTETNQDISYLLPGFDLSEIMPLLDGDYSQLQNIFVMFQEDFSDVADHISEKLNAGEIVAAEHQLHQMKGVAGNIGAIKLYDVSQALDIQLKQGFYDNKLWDEWKVVFSETLQIISNFIVVYDEKKLSN
jgi:signal transduction histidine kinase/DNA-binding response OmpR family regulator/HPt (histidine-containing phosphotransfer) domain-containing protein